MTPDPPRFPAFDGYDPDPGTLPVLRPDPPAFLEPVPGVVPSFWVDLAGRYLAFVDPVPVGIP